MSAAPVCHLSDDDLVAEVKRLARCENEATVHLITHLAELDARRLYLGAGFSSLFAYCTEVLRLSEHEAYNHIEAARASRRFPLILDRLGDAGLNLTTVRLLAPYLTTENHRQVLDAACGKNKREVEELLARSFPRPSVPFSVRKLPERSAAPPPETGAVRLAAAAGPAEKASGPPGSRVAAVALAPAARRPVVTPLGPARYEIRFTAVGDTYKKLRLAQDLLRHVIPSGDTAQIIDRALSALLEDLARKKFAATERPRDGRGAAPGSRHVPAEVKRSVWLRDAGRCAFVSPNGRRCSERGFLEFHHVRPYAAGGEATLDNIQMRCRAHNAYEADLYYGASRTDVASWTDERSASEANDGSCQGSGPGRTADPRRR